MLNPVNIYSRIQILSGIYLPKNKRVFSLSLLNVAIETHLSGGSGDSMVGANPNEDSLSTPATADRRKVNEQVPLVCAPPTLSTPLLVLHTRFFEPLPFFSLFSYTRDGRLCGKMVAAPDKLFVFLRSLSTYSLSYKRD